MTHHAACPVYCLPHLQTSEHSLNTAARGLPTGGCLFTSTLTSRWTWEAEMMKTSTANSNTSDTLQVLATTSHWENNMVVSVSFIYGIVIGIAVSIVVVTIVIAIIACLRTLEARLPWTTYELPRIRRSPGRPRSEVAVVEQEHPYSSLATGQPPPVPTCTPGDVSVRDLTGDLTSEAGSDTRPPPVPPRPAQPGLTKLRRLTQKLKLPTINGPSKT